MNHRDGRTPADTIQASLQREWTRHATGGAGARYTSGGLTVEMVEWKVPGFRNRTARGWALKAGEAQIGPAHRRAIDAMKAADHS